MMTLKDIIDEFMLSASDQDSYVYGVNRTLVLKHAKRCMEDFIYSAVPSTRILQQELPSHKTLEWPIGAIDIIRMSVVDSDGYLTPVYVNNRNPIVYEYTRDESGGIIYDDVELPIKASVDPEPIRDDSNSYDFSNYGLNYSYGRKYGLRGGVIGRGGTYKYNPETGKIHFFDLNEGDNIVFEYILNPLTEKSEAELEIIEYGRKPIDSYIYWKIIERRVSVSAAEKLRAKKEYYNDLRQAKKRILVKPDEIVQALKTKRSFVNW